MIESLDLRINYAPHKDSGEQSSEVLQIPHTELLRSFRKRIRQMDKAADAATKALGLPPEEQPSVLRAMFGQELPNDPTTPPNNK